MKKDKEQIDEMINEGLGGGQINNMRDKKQLENPISKNSIDDDIEKIDNSMTTDLEDMKKLGKEMESMKTKDE